MAVRSIQGITHIPQGGVSQNNSIGWDGKDPAEQFLKLLVAQITNQDPDHPMDSTDMITQFAQIQSALGLHNMTQASQTYQRVSTAASLMNQKVTLYDKERKLEVQGKVEAVDFTGAMPLIKVEGQFYPLDAVKTVGDV